MLFSLSDHTLEPTGVNEIDRVCEVLSLERSEGSQEGINHSTSRYSRESEEDDTCVGG